MKKVKDPRCNSGTWGTGQKTLAVYAFQTSRHVQPRKHGDPNGNPSPGFPKREPGAPSVSQYFPGKFRSDVLSSNPMSRDVTHESGPPPPYKVRGLDLKLKFAGW
jgi:hypothetical protein